MITTGDIANLLRPGLNKVFGLYTRYPAQWKEIFETRRSIMAYENLAEMQFTGPASIVQEGANIPVSSMMQKYLSNYTHIKTAVSFTITKEAIEDNLYKTQFPQQVRSIEASMKQAKNVLGANVLNNGFNPIYQGGDGQPLFSTQHPVSGGVYSNLVTANGVAVDLSEAGLEAAIIQIQKFPDVAGNLIFTNPIRLVVPRELQFAASRLLNSAYQPESANNAINPINHDNYFPKKFTVNQFLTDPNVWFVTTDAPDGLIHFQRTDVESNMYPTYNNESITAQATERFSFGWSNSRAAVAGGRI